MNLAGNLKDTSFIKSHLNMKIKKGYFPSVCFHFDKLSVTMQGKVLIIPHFWLGSISFHGPVVFLTITHEVINIP